uniref:Uncharacterized protein n=1 Tax=Anopheles culicifacies TaxID=139723 RepID=A0A182M093_9DIPT
MITVHHRVVVFTLGIGSNDGVIFIPTRAHRSMGQTLWNRVGSETFPQPRAADGWLCVNGFTRLREKTREQVDGEIRWSGQSHHSLAPYLTGVIAVSLAVAIWSRRLLLA